MDKNASAKLIDLIHKPLLTDKTTRILEDNQYCFTVKKGAKKHQIKQAIEILFNVKVTNINTLIKPVKKRTVGKYTGQKAIHKKVIVTLKPEDQIILFPEN
uniref:Large ribosomal subunit protein uL23c n=1 Tax=Liagoropsis maxima TaxID=1653392 RepID=A0A1G4NWE3_9FLOR|nr:Ribosomal protein L23 [Liagoropsis maxima]SCW22819.1 Ribosomal protein L23 [Liagoropsis maxima]